MENYKSASQVWLEMQEAEDKLAIDSLNKYYFDNIINPYRASDKIIDLHTHPKSLELSEKEFLILLKEMINFGLKGIEVYHSSHTKEEIKYYLEIANKYNLLISGGSVIMVKLLNLILNWVQEKIMELESKNYLYLIN